MTSWRRCSQRWADPLCGNGARRRAARRRRPQDRSAGVAALGVLAAEPLYLLFDTAVIGRLGALALAVWPSAVWFWAWSFSGDVSVLRHDGAFGAPLRAGDRVARSPKACRRPGWRWRSAVDHPCGADRRGALVSVIAGARAGSGDIAGAALPWLWIAILGTPAILISLAGNAGCGACRTPFGRCATWLPVWVVGTAVSAAGVRLAGLAANGTGRLGGANLVGQWLAALLFGGALLAERVSLRPDATYCGAIVLARDLIVRTMAFQACFISAAAVAARFGAAALAAHQVVLQLWAFSPWFSIHWPLRPNRWWGRHSGRGRRTREVGGMAGDSVFAACAGMLAAALALGAPVLPRCSPTMRRCSRRSPCRGGSLLRSYLLPESFSHSTGCCWVLVTPPSCVPRPWSARWRGSCRSPGCRWCTAGGWRASGRALPPSSCCG
ncbi:putative membrane protein [Mycobacterium ulcerans str. Harvey]|uniref:Membrane protein n=1 Tax=Mycobacterium ulcerans str. Harvey TaxID=1299332 RepID=A0ABN0RAK0_MYCUL|nr:putative membrane protein [Mycobacterium ulcerans str. Harvey]